MPEAAARSKTFVVDTNVLLHNPNALFAFTDNHVVIPMMVLEELDKFKTANNELGQNAREVARSLDNLRAKGSLREGVTTPQGGIIQVLLRHDEIAGMLPGVNDNRILGCAHLLKREGHNVFFVSKDINARIKSDALGIPSEDFKNQKVNADELYTGWVTVTAPSETVDALAVDEEFSIEGLFEAEDAPMVANQFIVVKDAADEDRYIIGMYDAETKKAKRIDDEQPELFGVSPRSPE